jgi:streptogramin lyase/plastocyanin
VPKGQIGLFATASSWMWQHPLARALAGGILLVSCVEIATVAAETVQNATTVITMTDAAPFFSRPDLSIKVGDTIEWINEGPEKTHIVADKQMNIFSGPIEVKGSWKHKFDYAGTFEIICGQHFYMRSRVTVHNPDGSTERRFEFPYQKAFKEFVIPTADAVPRMIIKSKIDDSMWFTIGGGGFYGFEEFPAQNKLAQVDDNGQFIEYSTPTPEHDGSKVGVDSLVMADNGDIWFTERLTNRIGVLRNDGTIGEFQIPTLDGYALGVDIDQQGNVWFAERQGNRIGFITPDGIITEIEMPRPNSEPRTIYVDRHGRVWYTAREANEIGYYDPEKKSFSRIRIPTKLARPAGIAEGKDGAIYFVQMVGNKIGKIEGDKVTEYPLPTSFAAPFKIVADDEGILWFTEVYGNAIGRFDPHTGAVTEYKIPTKDSRPGGIAIDNRGRVWFTEQKGNKVGYLDPKMLPDDYIRQTKGTPVPPARQTSSDGDLPNKESSRRGVRTNFAIPIPGAHPGSSLVEDSNRRFWFPLILANRVAVYDPSTGNYRDYEMPTEISMPSALDIDRSGDVWIAEFRGNRLARLATDTGHVTEYEVPVANALPSGITIDEFGVIWVTLLNANSIASFDKTTHRFQQYTLPRADSSPLNVNADGKGSLWVSASNEDNSYLARFDLASHKYEIVELPLERAVPVGMVVGPNEVWVALGGAGAIGRLDTANRTWSQYLVPGPVSEPAMLARDNEGKIWATDGGGLGSYGGNQLVVIDPKSGLVETIPMAVREAKPLGIIAASDGQIWFTQQGANRLSSIGIIEGRQP